MIRFVIALAAIAILSVPAAGQDDFWTQLEAEAVDEWRYPAEQGDAVSQYNLGLAYMNGLGVTMNLAEAVKWYRLAAEQGLVFAQSNLGRMYNNGFGLKRDDVQAHFWFDMAAAQGDNFAAKNRDRIARRLTPEQLAEARNLSRHWLAKKQP